MDVNGITNLTGQTGPDLKPERGQGAEIANSGGGNERSLAVTEARLQASQVSPEERKSQVISLEEIQRLLMLKLAGSVQQQNRMEPGNLIDIKS